MNIARSLSVGFQLTLERTKSQLVYTTNFWAITVGTLAFSAVMVLFIIMLSMRVGTIAGYGRDSFILMILIGQLTWLVMTTTMGKPMARLNEQVNNGNFDFVLLRPMSSLWYVYANGTDLVYALLNIGPYLVITLPFINWDNLAIPVSRLLPALLVWVSGLGLMRFMYLLMALPAFTSGDSGNLLDVSYSMLSQYLFPFSATPTYMKVLGMSVIPTILLISGTAFVLVDAGDHTQLVIIACIIGCVSQLALLIMWKWALRRYTSASS